MVHLSEEIAMNDFVTSCPICRNVHYVWDGNKDALCDARALSGEVIVGRYKAKDSWRGTVAAQDKTCGFPLLRPDGEKWKHLPTERYVQMTRNSFSPLDIWKAVLEFNHISLDEHLLFVFGTDTVDAR
jgi:hypothetical protein